MTERQILTDSTLTLIVNTGAIAALMVAIGLHYVRAWHLLDKWQPAKETTVRVIGKKSKQ